jgi:outer membrane lipoprotein-sorting protein
MLLKNKTGVKILLACYLLIIVQFDISAQMSVDSIINNHLNTTGLRNFKAELNNFSIDGEILQNNMSFPIKIKGVVPEKFRMDMTFNKMDFTKTSNGKTKWEYNPMTDSLSTGIADKNEASEFIERWCGALYLYGEQNTSVKMKGIITIDDIDVYKIEFQSNEQSRVYYIDKYTYLIVRIDDDYVENKITYYSDYRKTGNYYLPYSITGYENGIPMMSMKFKEVKLNPGISADLFSKPK